MTRLRSGKTTSEAEDDSVLNHVELIYDDLNEEEDELDGHLADHPHDHHLINHAARIEKKSLYAKLREDLNDLDDSNLLNGDGLKKRNATSRAGRSRSSSRTRSKEKSTMTRERINMTSETITTTTTIYKQVPSSNERGGKCSTLLVFLIIAILAGGGFFIYNKYFNPPTVDEVLQNYKDNLVGLNNDTIKAAIRKYNVTELEKPVVLLLYGENQELIEKFYLDLASAIKGGANVKQTAFKIDGQIEDYLVEKSLNLNRIVFLDGIEKLKGTNYQQLYRLVDGEDAVVTDCLIVLSLYSNSISRAKDLNDLYKVDKEVRNVLRNRWNDINAANLEALLNRIVQFPTAVL